MRGCHAFVPMRRKEDGVSLGFGVGDAGWGGGMVGREGGGLDGTES